MNKIWTNCFLGHLLFDYFLYLPPKCIYTCVSLGDSVPHPTTHHTLKSPLLFRDELQLGLQRKWARAVVMCLRVWGGREVVGLGRRVFGTQSIDWWSKLGGPGLTERRSVSGNICPQLSAVWSIPAQWWAREALLLIKRSHRYARRLNSFYGSVFTHILKYLYKVEKASLHLNVLVWDELLKTHCWVYEGELSVCFVSLCQGDFTSDLAHFFLYSTSNCFLFLYCGSSAFLLKSTQFRKY